jgi:hypothetical protein
MNGVYKDFIQCVGYVTLTPTRYLELVLRLLRVFENRVLRRIFGPKRDEVTGE